MSMPSRQLNKKIQFATLFSPSAELHEIESLNIHHKKEERGFLNWINFELCQLENKLQNNFTPGVEDFDAYEHNYQMAVKLVSGQKLPAFHDSLYIQDEQVISTNKNLFLNSPFPYFRSKLQKEFESGRIAPKSTVNFLYDVVLKEEIIALFTTTYSEWWLRFGLEVLSGRYFPSYTYPNIKKIFNQVLFSPTNTIAKFDTSQMVIFYSILLIYFLDLIRSQMIQLKISAPLLLFQVKGYEYTSIDLLKVLLEKTLQPQGDIVKQFSFYGANFIYRQRPCDELPYRISLLSTDLRDGIQLSRLLTHITDDNTFLALNMKTHSESASSNCNISNVNSIFSLLEKKGISFHVNIPGFGLQIIVPKDIVDGHQQKTISLLWKIICSWKIPLLVSHTNLQKEIYHLYSKQLITRNPPKLICLQEVHSQLADASVGYISLLFEWSWIIGEAMSNIPVKDFTSSFVDGRVFSAILLYYKPSKTAAHTKNWMEFFVNKMKQELPLIMPPDLLLANGAIIDEKAVIFLLAFLSFLFLKDD